MPLQAVIFDLDDTLIWDERLTRAAFAACAALAESRTGLAAAGVAQAAAAAAERLWRAGAPVDACDALGVVAAEGLWGDFSGSAPWLQQLQAWVPEFRRTVWREALAGGGVHDEALAGELAAHFAQLRKESQSCLPDAEETLAWVRKAGLKLGLLTNGAPALQRGKLDRSGLGPWFAAVAVSGELGFGKPEPAIFHHLTGLLGVPPSEALMVGNSLSRDVLGAQRAGLPSCWLALPGEEEPVGLVHPDHTITRLAELPAVIRSRGS